jgi:hypothetical protein
LSVKKLVLLVCVMIAALAAGVAIRATQSSAATAETPTVPGMSVAQLAKAGFAIEPARTPDQDVSQADALKAAATADPGEKVLGSTLGYCDLSASGFPSRDCYVVSFDVTGEVFQIFGGIQYKGPESTPMLNAGVLIDATTGEEIYSWQQGSPTN